MIWELHFEGGLEIVDLRKSGLYIMLPIVQHTIDQVDEVP